MFERPKARTELISKKENDSKIPSFLGTYSKKLTANETNEIELKQLENDSTSLLNSLGIMDIAMNRDLDQLKLKLGSDLVKFKQGKSLLSISNN
jgi:hypothetical protein